MPNNFELTLLLSCVNQATLYFIKLLVAIFKVNIDKRDFKFSSMSIRNIFQANNRSSAKVFIKFSFIV